MNYERRVNYTNAKELKHLHALTCENALAGNRKIVEDKVRKVNAIRDYSNTADFRKYGLYPGQQIRRFARRFIPHAAIYLYDGLVVEIGSGPKKCRLGMPYPRHIHLAGLTTIRYFKRISKKHGVTAYKVITDKDSDPKEIRRRMKRVLDIFGWYKYNFFVDNCLHMSNYVTHGHKKYFTVLRDYFRLKPLSQKTGSRRRSRRSRKLR